MAATAVFSSDARDFFRFCVFGSFKETSALTADSSAETSEEDLETVRGIVSDCAEEDAAVHGTCGTAECCRGGIIG